MQADASRQQALRHSLAGKGIVLRDVSLDGADFEPR
jgi:hypothetical protein